MDDQLRKPEDWTWTQVQQLVSNYRDQSRRGREHSRIAGLEPMAWPTQPYVTSRIGPTDCNRLHLKALDKEKLL